MFWLARVLLGALFLLCVVLSVPIAFDVGGRDCGLAYSLALFAFYLASSALHLAAPLAASRVVSALSYLARAAQPLLLPALLIWALSRFAVDAGGSDWVASSLGAARKHGLVERLTLGAWDKTLRYSSPVFQLLEGFCSLLVIQAAGQITRWLVNRGRSDTWVIVLLIFSASIITTTLYFLYRVACFPYINNLDATLIGVTMTSAVFLCAFGIISGRGNPVESSLLFAYVVLCVYQIFTDYLPSPDAVAATDQRVADSPSAQPEFPPLPPIIMASYTTLLHMLSSLPTAVSSSLAFLYAAFQTITPSVIISLTYRIIVFSCATRIIPAVRESGARALMDEPSLDDADAAGRLVGFLSWFSPSILIAIYTSLLLQHFSTSVGGDEGWTLRGGADAGGNAWRWINLAVTMILYAFELYLGDGTGESGLTNHWKTD